MNPSQPIKRIEPAPKGRHRSGDCRCHNHEPLRYYNGYAQCLRCNKLAPISGRFQFGRDYTTRD